MTHRLTQKRGRRPRKDASIRAPLDPCLSQGIHHAACRWRSRSKPAASFNKKLACNSIVCSLCTGMVARLVPLGNAKGKTGKAGAFGSTKAGHPLPLARW